MNFKYNKINIPVFIIASDNNILQAMVAMVSVVKNTKNFIEFYILDKYADRISETNLKYMNKLRHIYKNFSYEIITMNENDFSEMKIAKSGYIPSDSYFRYYIPNLKTKFDKIVYIDYDTIVTSDITELYNIELGDNYIGVINNEKGFYLSDYLVKVIKKIGIKDVHSYFNAGVLLFNCNKYRQDNMAEVLVQKTLEISDKVDIADQDIMNIVFEGSYYELPCEWNSHPNKITENYLPKLIHYVGFKKPWVEDTLGSELWWEYAKFVPYYKEMLKNIHNYNRYEKFIESLNSESKILSLKYTDTHKIITILGIKFKFKLPDDKLVFSKNLDKVKTINNINDFVLDRHKVVISSLNENDKRIMALSSIFKSTFIPFNNIIKNYDYCMLYGSMYSEEQSKCLNFALKTNMPLLIIEDGFLKSISTKNLANSVKDFRTLSYMINSTTTLFDASKPSILELMLNDNKLILKDEQKQRAKNAINTIITNHLSKYNHLPIITPQIGREGLRKILVVDQRLDDITIPKGMASDETFKTMLECAIKENPDADIIVKSFKGKIGHYSSIKQEGNIFLYTQNINPISLIQYCDEVYTCTSEMGFEALMCNKKVHCFGVSYYSNYGLTNDRIQCKRRKVKRTIEEMFYIIYIMFSYYINPDKNIGCELEECIDYIIKNREKYYEKRALNNVKLVQDNV